MRKVARETGLNREAFRRIAKNELGIKAYKLQKAQLLTEENKKVRIQRCRALLQRHAGPEILFQMKKFLQLNPPTIIKMTGHGQQSLRFPIKLLPIPNILNLLWFGLEFAFGQDTLGFCESWGENQ